jgi:hypothetical protein
MKYRKKSVVVEAVQFDPAVTQLGVFREKTGRPYVVTIHNEEAHIVPGDWIIAEPDGEHFYPCKPDIFAATYEPAEEEPAAPKRARGWIEVRHKHSGHLFLVQVWNICEVVDGFAGCLIKQIGDDNVEDDWLEAEETYAEVCAMIAEASE